MNKDQMLQRLVENAIDFLKRAVHDIEANPKFSVISFHSAVELFLKARLMAEHWTLVVTRRTDPDLDKFFAGDFQSVSLDEAADRLDKVVKSGLTSHELQAFKDISKHRNKMVHFFHEVQGKAENDGLRAGIVKQQLTAWYFLHLILATRWNEIFRPWTEDISAVHAELQKLHVFLQVIYDQRKPSIDALEKEGVLFDVCPSCGFHAQQQIADLDYVYEAGCVVCGLDERRFRTKCPNCDGIVSVRGDGSGVCDSCETRFSLDEIVGGLTDEAAAHAAAMDGDDSWDAGNCSDCDGFHTVIRTKNDQYVCTDCFGVFDRLERCGWCNEPNTGNMEASDWAGCSHCDGRAGWDD